MKLTLTNCLFQLVTFEVPHKPGYRLKMRMGIHSGSVVAGVVGTKIPHYSVFGETVEIAGLMESTGEPMKIQVFFFRRLYGNQTYRSVFLLTQISSETRDYLKPSGTFNTVKRDTINSKIPEGMTTFWLIGVTAGTTTSEEKPTKAMVETELHL